jgi:hypothetical protein
VLLLVPFLKISKGQSRSGLKLPDSLSESKPPQPSPEFPFPEKSRITCPSGRAGPADSVDPDKAIDNRKGARVVIGIIRGINTGKCFTPNQNIHKII